MSIELKNVTVAFPDKVVLDGFSLSLPEQGMTCIFGPSGCGKTTLFRCLTGLIKPDSGAVEGVQGRSISMVFQENRLLPWFDALENVAFVVGGDRERAMAALEAMEIAEEARKWPSELSGGMQRRVALARAWAYDGDMLLLDEPTAGLDPELSERVMDRFCQRWQGRPALMITHEQWLAERFGDRLYIAAGTPLALSSEWRVVSGE